jgi:nitroreductase
MEKPAETKYEIADVLRRRWSPRVFSDRNVEPEKLRSLFEAARWAPSSFNEQPWNFIVATKNDRPEFDKLLSSLVEGNQKWARLAPVLMVSVARLNFEKTGKSNRHAFHDVGQAVALMTGQATVMGLFVHQMAGFSPEKVRELYSLPDGFEPVAAIAIGYGVEADAVPEDLRARELSPRSRKPVESFVFDGRWGEASPLVSE